LSAEVTEERSEEVGALSAEAVTGPRTEQRKGNSEEVDTSCGYDGATCTIADGDGRSGETATSSHQLDSTSTIDEEEATRIEGNCSHEPSAAPTAEAAGTSPGTTSEAVDPDDSTTSNSAKCPICLATFTAEEVATPDTCDHRFCVGCLEEWSASSNTCPLHRQEFSVMLVRRYPDGEIIRRIPLTPRTDQSEYDLVLPHAIFCSFCGQSPGEGLMFFCLGCAHFYHSACLDSLMDGIPNEERFCPFCAIIALLTSDI
jgi:PHD and RING finger domain-containing protein 1